MNPDQTKQLLGQAAAKAILPLMDPETFIGVGTGSTANYFIDALADVRHLFAGAVASSVASADRLKAHNILVISLNESGPLSVYVDGADEIAPDFSMIKGGGGALTREKIVAAAAEHFICIADQTKWVSRLGRFPLPIEVIPMARSSIARKLVGFGGTPVLRENFITDNGNEILDVHDLTIDEPVKFESMLNDIPGVVTNGLFALRPADQLIMDDAGDIHHYQPGQR